LNYENDISPFEIYENIKNEINKNTNKSNNDLTTVNDKDYLSKRKTIIKFYKSFIRRLKYQDKTFYLAVFLMDLIIRTKNEFYEIKIESIGLGCLISAGK
jgi:hypothetical protein